MMMTTQKFSRERGKKQLLQRRQICNFKEKQPKKKKRPKREKQNPQNAKEEEEEEARFNIINSESFFLLATREERLLKGKKV